MNPIYLQMTPIYFQMIAIHRQMTPICPKMTPTKRSPHCCAAFGPSFLLAAMSAMTTMKRLGLLCNVL